MSVDIKFVPNPELDVTKYNVYKSDDQTDVGTYTKIGEVIQDRLAAFLTYTDSGGTAADFYKLTAVDTLNNESQSTNAFQPRPVLTTRVFDTLFDGSDQPLEGERVEAVLDVPQAKYRGLVIPTKLVALTDARGVWHIDLYPNANIVPASTVWIITIKNQSQRVTIPVGTFVEYNTIPGLF